MKELVRSVYAAKDKYKTQISVVSNCSQEDVTLSSLENRIKELRKIYGDCVVSDINEIGIYGH